MHCTRQGKCYGCTAAPAKGVRRYYLKPSLRASYLWCILTGITLRDIASTVDGTLHSSFKDEIIVRAQSLGSTFTSDSIGWCSDDNAGLLDEVGTGAVLVSKALYSSRGAKTSGPILIGVDNPRRAFALILRSFFVEGILWGNIATSAFIDESVTCDRRKVNIGHNVVIEADVVIGDYVTIGHNSIVKSGTSIKNNVSVGANCTIGGVGFGYEMSDAGMYEVIPHIGNVVLEKHVEIGNNVCVDRAVLGSTILNEKAKSTTFVSRMA